MLANHLHWNILDSGAIYRVLAYAARKNQVESGDITMQLAALAQSLNLRFESSDNQ